MQTPSTSENNIQKYILKLLQNMGFIYIKPENMNQYRDSVNEVVLKDVLKQSLKNINNFEYKSEKYSFSDNNINQAVKDLDIPLVEGLISTNEKIYDKLILGDSYEETLKDGSKISFQLKYIDFENIENNVFHVTEEFIVEKKIEDHEKTKRADIVLFVNGIPLGIIELKKSSIHIKKGISQLINYQKNNNIPHFFKYNQITMVGNTNEAKYATTGTPDKFYNVWKEENDEDLKGLIVNREITSLDKSVFSIFEKRRFLEIVKSFIVYDNNVKKIARYQQFFAIENIIERIGNFTESGIRKGGLIWHTQGSGKSLTMVMLARKIKDILSNAKIIVVTDRINLDKQIRKTFYHSGIKVLRAKTGSKLVEYLEKDKSEVITTVINKFESVVNNNIRIDSSDIFVLVDESHRTQYGTLASKMRNVFPKACYLGFTGTPLKRKDKDSAAKFGGIIHKYTINDAVDDGAVLPLLYEGRMVEQDVINKFGMDRKFEFISRKLNVDEKADLKRKWARLQNIVASEDRLLVIAININEHFKKNWKDTGFKGMFATNSKFEAIKYNDIFQEIGEIKTAYIISPPEMNEGNDSIDSENKKVVQKAWAKLMEKYKDAEHYEKTIIDNFVNGDGSNQDDVDILIVVDKLLTGFDAPKASVLYIDKQLKDYRLLQAIARVNRLDKGKDYGFIMDYRGLLGDLDKALTDYSALDGFDEDDIKDIVGNIENSIKELQDKLSDLENIFKDIKYKDDLESYIIVLEDDKKRKDFYKRFKNYSKKLKICLSSEKYYDFVSKENQEKYNNSIKFYNELRKASRIRYREEVDFSEFEGEMRKLLDTYISAGEVNQLTKIVNIFEIEKFDEEVTRIEGKKAKADTIKNAVSKVITEKMDQNPDYYGKISLKIQKIIEDYKNKRITEEAYLESVSEIMNELRKNNESTGIYHEILQDDKFSMVLYDNTSEYLGSYIKDADEEESDKEEKISILIKDITNVFRHYENKPDWKENLDVHKEINKSLLDLIWNFEDLFQIEIDTDEIIEKIMKIALSRREV